MNYQRAVMWERMEVCNSVMKYDDFMKIVRDAVDDYYNQLELEEAKEGKKHEARYELDGSGYEYNSEFEIFPGYKMGRGCREDDIRTTALIRYIKDVLEKGSKDSQWTILQAVLKGYKEVVNSLSWITGYKVISSYVDLYQLASYSCVTEDLGKMVDYIMINEIFNKPYLDSVKNIIMGEVERQELMMKMAR